MVFSENPQNHAVRGKPKGAEVIFRERGLWPANGRRSDGFKFLLRCPSYREGCDTNFKGGCCAQQILSQQQDFRSQKGQLAEEVEAAHHLIISTLSSTVDLILLKGTIFYPQFHCTQANKLNLFNLKGTGVQLNDILANTASAF